MKEKCKMTNFCRTYILFRSLLYVHRAAGEATAAYNITLMAVTGTTALISQLGISLLAPGSTPPSPVHASDLQLGYDKRILFWNSSVSLCLKVSLRLTLG